MVRQIATEIKIIKIGIDMALKERVEEVAQQVNEMLSDNPEGLNVGFILVAIPLGVENPSSVWVSNMPRPDVVEALGQLSEKSRDNFINNLKLLN